MRTQDSLPSCPCAAVTMYGSAEGSTATPPTPPYQSDAVAHTPSRPDRASRPRRAVGLLAVAAVCGVVGWGSQRALSSSSSPAADLADVGTTTAGVGGTGRTGDAQPIRKYSSQVSVCRIVCPKSRPEWTHRASHEPGKARPPLFVCTAKRRHHPFLISA